jgi:hypothetical protein
VAGDLPEDVFGELVPGGAEDVAGGNAGAADREDPIGVLWQVNDCGDMIRDRLSVVAQLSARLGDRLRQEIVEHITHVEGGADVQPHHDVIRDAESLLAALQQDAHAGRLIGIGIRQNIPVDIQSVAEGSACASLLLAYARIIRVLAESLEVHPAFDTGMDVLHSGVPPAKHGQPNGDAVQELVAVAHVQTVIPSPSQPSLVAVPTVRQGWLHTLRMLGRPSPASRLLPTSSHRRPVSQSFGYWRAAHC